MMLQRQAQEIRAIDSQLTANGKSAVRHTFGRQTQFFGNFTGGSSLGEHREDRLLEVGEMASTGATLVRLIGANNLKIVAGVPSRYSDVVNAGDQAEAWFDFQDSDTLNLSIDYVGQSIDPQARTFRVEMFLPRQTTNYKVDMIANVRLKTYEQQDAIVVGEEFVYQKDRGFVVYTVNENDQGNKIASEKVVKLGPSYENEVVVNSGLQPGDQLITVGSSFLQDSMRINIVANGSSQEFAQRN
jgi:RND family efflux transporter MFP subunit